MTTIHTSRRDSNREGFLADPLTMYSIDHIFGEAFSMSMFHKLVLGEYNIDLDYIYDRCEESHFNFEKALKLVSDTLYDNSNIFIKNKLIYKYFHEVGLEISSLSRKVRDYLEELVDISDIDTANLSSNHVTNIIKNRYKNTLDEYANFGNGESHEVDGYMDTPNFKLLRCIDDFLYNHLDVYRKLVPDISLSFNTVVKNTYRIRLAKSSRIFNSFLSSETSPIIRNTLYNDTTRTTGSTITMISTPTSTPSYLQNTFTTNQTTSTTITMNLRNSAGFGWEDLLRSSDQYRSHIQLKEKAPPKINKKTPGVKILNKSLKIIRKFFQAKDLDDFLKCLEVTIPGERFNYGFRLRKRSDLITYSNSMRNFSINWDLNIYTKDEQKVARACVTFKNSPILDQVLSAYLLIKSGKEDEILINSGFFDHEPLYDTILKPLVNSLKEKDKAKKMDEDRLAPIFGQETLDGSDRYQNMRRNRYLEHIRNQTEISTVISNWIRDYILPRGFDWNLYNYTTNLDVSFGEAVDYEAFNLFNITVFDHLVKPLTWKKDLFRFKNRILLEPDPKKEVIKKFTPLVKQPVRLTI